jgi:DNA transformation protein
MAVSDSYENYLIEQLEGLGRLRSKRMFGGVGIYCDELFFALIDDNTLYFKVDDSNRADYTGRGMGPFRPFPDKPGYEMGYFQVPADVIEDAEALIEWARGSMRVAAAAPRKAARKKRTVAHARRTGGKAPPA